MPIQEPTALRRHNADKKPITANPVTSTSNTVCNGKNMSTNVSPYPVGWGSYFMSVMYAWLSTNGTTQNADSSTAVPITEAPYLHLAGSRCIATTSRYPRNTNNSTMP